MHSEFATNRAGDEMLSEDGQRLVDAMRDYIAPFVAPVASGAIGYFAGRKRINAEANKLDADAQALQLDSITRHFQALIAGYEARVKDLTDEIENLRDEVLNLRQALDQRPRPRDNNR